MSKNAVELTLAEAVDQIDYGACCNRCRETHRIDLAQLLARFGPHFTVDEIRPRLICTKCDTREIIVVTLWKSASSTEQMTAHWK